MKNYRKAIEKLYQGKMTVVERQAKKDEITKRIEFDEVIVYRDIPCRLSFSNKNTTSEIDNAFNVTQQIKVFCATELNIKAGSKLIITQNNVTNEYVHSGKSAIYSAHQEIPLELFKEWA